MKWFARSCVVAVIGGCVSLVVLAASLLQDGPGSSWVDLLRRGRAPASAQASPAGQTGDTLAVMHARNYAQLEDAISQIREEFGLDVTAPQFSSHHAARDYLERLYLAREAKSLGLEVDPHDFGDDEFMRRHIRALSRGEIPPAAPGGALGAPPAALAAPLPTGLNRSEYVFINGQRYYHDGHGAYVCGDGTTLRVSGAANGRPSETPAESAPARDPLTNLLPQLEGVLDMLGPLAGGQDQQP